MVQEKINKVIDSDDEVSPTRTKPSWKMLFIKEYTSTKTKWNDTGPQYYIQEKDKINIEMN